MDNQQKYLERKQRQEDTKIYTKERFRCNYIKENNEKCKNYIAYNCEWFCSTHEKLFERKIREENN